MNKKTRISLLVSSWILVVGACILPTVGTTIASTINSNDSLSNETTNKTNSKLLLPSIIDGKYISFDSLDDAMKNIYANSKVYPVNYIGDFNSAVNPNNNEVLPNRGVYEYIAPNIHDAYKTAKGQYTKDKLAATQSYLWDTDYQYMDASGYLHENLSDAQNANDDYNRKQTMGVSYYKINDKTNGKEYMINPLNERDIDYFKKIAIRNLGIDSSGFKVSPIVFSEYGKMNSTEIFSNFTEDDVVNTIYKILQYLFKHVNDLKFSADISLSIKKMTVENWHPIRKVPGPKPGITWYQVDRHEEILPDSPGYIKHEIDILMRGTASDDHNGVLSLENVSNDDFSEVFSPFILDEVFKDTFAMQPATRYNKKPVGCYWDDAPGARYTLDYNYISKYYDYFKASNDYTLDNLFFYIEPNLEQLKEDVWYRTQGSLMVREAKIGGFDVSGKYYTTSSFVVDGHTDLTKIFQKKDEIIKDLTNIIFENLIFQNSKIVNVLPNKKLYEDMKNDVKNIATNVFLAWISAVQDWKLTQNDDSVLRFTNDYQSDFQKNDETSYSKESFIRKLVSESWWVSNLYSSNLFADIVNSCKNVWMDFGVETYKNALLISFNDAPVFMITDLSALKIQNAREESQSSLIRKINDWSNSAEYDPKSLQNVSDKISFFDETYTFGIEEGAKSNTKMDPEITNPYVSNLYRYNIDTNQFSIGELSANQHLLLSSSDSVQMLRNDTGLASAFYLYNKNINKILSSENSKLYIESISKEDIGSKNVLRLYNKITEDNYNGDYLSSRHTYPVFYGEIRAKIGTFNPSIYDKYLMSFQKEIDSITSNITPLEVPVVRINGKTYVLAKLANPDTVIVTGKIEELVNSAARNLVQYIRPSDNYVFYNIGTSGQNELILINNEVKQIVEYDLNLGMINSEVFDGKTKFLFTTNTDGDAYLRNRLKLSAIYENSK